MVVSNPTALSTKSIRQAAMSKNKGIISIDNGGRYTKYASDKGSGIFSSNKAFGWKMNVGSEDFNEGDFAVLWNGVLYYVGDVVLRENSDRTIDGNVNTKTDDYFILSVLLSCAKYGYEENHIICSVPIKDNSNEAELLEIERLLKKTHTLEVNGESITFHIRSVTFAAEGVNAFWMFETEGKSRWLDLGSRTVNFATIVFEGENTYTIDTESGTIEVGLEKSNFPDYKQYVKVIQNHLNRKKWNVNDAINLVGGGALNKDLIAELVQTFPNAEVVENPQMVQVLGMLELGKALIVLD